MGYVSETDSAVGVLLEGVTILQNRGYDSAGVATISPEKDIVVSKYASVGTTSDSIKILKDRAPARHEGHRIGIAHTRWATHGGKTDANAHPHCDQKDRISLVHNGTIENSSELKAELVAKGVEFKSQTDTEVIAQLIGVYLDQGMDLNAAITATLARLEGTWGLCVISKDNPDQIIVTRHGSPMVIGLGKGHMFVASEPSAFVRHTSQYVELVDDEIAIVTSKGLNLDISKRQREAPNEKILLSPDPHPHWTIREISEQPEALARSLNFGGRIENDSRVRLGGLEENRDLLLSIDNLLISGCGTSLYAGSYAAALMRWVGAFRTVQTLDAAEVDVNSFPNPHSKSGIMVLSQSGETRDVIDALQAADALSIPKFSVVNAVGSFIARSTKCGVYVNAGREHAVASTKAFTTQVAVGGLIACWFSQNRTYAENETFRERRIRLIDALHRLPIYAGMILHDRPAVKKIAHKLQDAQHIFVLGKGFSEPIAYEGALKIKEITYIHAEGYSGGALKHGPFALIEPGTPIILLILDDEHAAMMRTCAEEVRARGARTIVITDNPKLAQGVSDEWIYIPSNGPLTALLGVIPIQLLAYELSIARGIDPDKPRHLAKAVTTR
jgi:glucosamine--fructose-6-phosphate aminotransferase (isomerizing)